VVLPDTLRGDGKWPCERHEYHQLAECSDRIFIIEGCLTIFVSLASLSVIPPFPEHCKFLSPDMKALMLARIKLDGSHVADDSISFKKTFKILSDWKIWAG
jgi:hypothetical protein